MIQITKETANRIKEKKLTNRESYNDIINRLLEAYK